MKNDILEILQQHKLGHIPDEQALNELCVLFSVVGQSEQLKPKEQICYKSNEPCKYDCSGLCKESY